MSLHWGTLPMGKEQAGKCMRQELVADLGKGSRPALQAVHEVVQVLMQPSQDGQTFAAVHRAHISICMYTQEP